MSPDGQGGLATTSAIDRQSEPICFTRQMHPECGEVEYFNVHFTDEITKPRYLVGDYKAGGRDGICIQILSGTLDPEFSPSLSEFLVLRGCVTNCPSLNPRAD